VAIRIQLGEDGKPFAEFGTPSEAAEFMRIFGKSSQTRQAPPLVSLALPKQEPALIVDVGHATRVPTLKADSRDIDGFLLALKPTSRRVLALLCEMQDGGSTGDMAQAMGVEANSFSGMCTGISKLGNKFGIPWKDLVVSEARFRNGSRIHFLQARPLLLSLQGRLGQTAPPIS
jgi:hypothetical protein